jgi:hypothetical protein
MKPILKKPYRYAIYLAPRPNSDWWHAGSEWLGRCAARDQAMAQSCPPSIAPEKFTHLTAHPRRYGWHATMKAPFVLREGADFNQLKDELALVCEQFHRFELPKLQVTRLDDFLALTPLGDTTEISRVERACVTQLHGLAAPLPPDELLRRRSAGLSLAKDAMLLKWGYPHVLDYFRFHISLTGPLRDCSELQIQSLIHFASEKFNVLPPCQFESLAIFVEPERGADFVLLEHCMFLD